MISLVQLLILFAIAGLCGSLGQALVGYSRGGCVLSVVIGFVGAVIGAWLVDVLGLPPLFTVRAGGANFPIVWSIVGSALFVALLGWLGPRRPSGRGV